MYFPAENDLGCFPTENGDNCGCCADFGGHTSSHNRVVGGIEVKLMSSLNERRSQGEYFCRATMGVGMRHTLALYMPFHRLCVFSVFPAGLLEVCLRVFKVLGCVYVFSILKHLPLVTAEQTKHCWQQVGFTQFQPVFGKWAHFDAHVTCR